MLWRAADHGRRMAIERARIAYLAAARQVWSVDAATAALAGEIAALIPDPPTPPKRSHRLAESRTERLVRWRFDGIIAATALVTGMPLIHNNPSDFEAIRGSIESHSERFSHVGSLNLIRCGAMGA